MAIFFLPPGLEATMTTFSSSPDLLTGGKEGREEGEGENTLLIQRVSCPPCSPWWMPSHIHNDGHDQDPGMPASNPTSHPDPSPIAYLLLPAPPPVPPPRPPPAPIPTADCRTKVVSPLGAPGPASSSSKSR